MKPRSQSSLLVRSIHTLALGGTLLAGAATLATAAESDTLPIVATGDSHSFILTDEGLLYAWGRNQFGQLGIGNTTNEPNFEQVQVPVGGSPSQLWLAVDGGREHSLGIVDSDGVLANDGSDTGVLYVWGNNNRGQLANGTSVGDPELTPIRVNQISDDGVLSPAGNDWVQVYAGADHNLALKADGSVYAWGATGAGQTGNGDVSTSVVDIPERIYISAGVPLEADDIAAGEFASFAISPAGELYSWGTNFEGQLGVEPTTLFQSYSPYLVDLGGISLDAIAAGYGHVLALTDAGLLYTWGRENEGQLGQGASPVNPSIPTPVPTGLVGGRTEPLPDTWKSISAGGFHSIAVADAGNDSNGDPLVDTVWTFGRNDSGQLGLGDFNRRTLPTRSGDTNDAVATTAGAAHSLVLASEGAISGFGANSFGQLGIGSTTNQNTPTTGLFGLPNLVFTQLTLSPSNDYIPDADGVSLMLSVGFANVGLGELTINDEYTVELRLSTDTTFSENDVPLPITEWANNIQTFTGDLIPSSPTGSPISEVITVNFTIPTELDAGDYYIVAQIVAGPTINESILTDNTIRNGDDDLTPGDSVISIFPDVQIEIPVNPSISPAPVGNLIQVGQGDVIDFDILVTNSGLATLQAGNEDRIDFNIYLSEDNSINTEEDVLLTASPISSATLPVVPPMPNASREILPFNPAVLPDQNRITFGVRGLVLPESVPLGTYFLLVEADFNNSVTELDEANNIGVLTPILLEVNGVDLADAVDNPELRDLGDNSLLQTLEFTSTGNTPWFGRLAAVPAEDTIVNGSFAKTPELAVGQVSRMQTVVDGPSIIAFNWKVDSGNPQNFLRLLVNGVEPVPRNAAIDSPGRITNIASFPSGEVRYILSNVSNQVIWEYQQNVDTAEVEGGFVDNVHVEPVDAPDFVIDSVSFTAVGAGAGDTQFALVPGVTELDITVFGRNQGATADLATLGDDFTVRAWLSTDRQLGGVTNSNDIFITDLNLVQDLDADSRFVYRAITVLPDLGLGGELAPGDYYLAIHVDADPVADGVIPTSPAILPITNDSVDEYVNPAFNFDGEANNVFISTDPSISITPLPDFDITAFSYVNTTDLLLENGLPGIFIQGEDISVTYTLSNIGDLDVEEASIDSRLILATDSDLSAPIEFQVANSLGGLPIGNNIDIPITRRVGSFFGESIDYGRRYFIGAEVNGGIAEDSYELSIEEKSILNNTSKGLNDNEDLLVVFSKVSIREALDINADLLIDNGGTQPFVEIVNAAASGDFPFYGQLDITNDGQDALRNVFLGTDQTASIALDVRAPDTQDLKMRFHYRVNGSPGELGDGRDALFFSIDGVDQLFSGGIAGVAGFRDWTDFDVVLPAGETYRALWEFIESPTDADNLRDFAWIDQVQLSAVDLAPTLIQLADTSGSTYTQTFLNTTGLMGGDVVDVTLTMANLGLADDTQINDFDVQFILSTDSLRDAESPGEPNDIIITTVSVPAQNFSDTRTEAEILADGFYTDARFIGSTTLGGKITRRITIPSDITVSQDYFLIAFVDPDEDVLDVDTSNNARIAYPLLINPNLPDLSVEVFADGTVNDPFTGGVVDPGVPDAVDFELVINNIGAADLSESTPYTITVTLSPDEITGNTGDIVLLDNEPLTVGITAGGSLAISTDTIESLPIPSTTPDGFYYLIVEVDAGNAITEPDESNNVFISDTASIQVVGLNIADAIYSEDPAVELLDATTLASLFADPEAYVALNPGFSEFLPQALPPITNGGDQFWYGEDDPAALRSIGDIVAQTQRLNDDQTSFVETTLPGPSIIKFNWLADTTNPSNVLIFTIDGAEKADFSNRLFNEPEWQSAEFVLPAGNNVVRWTYQQSLTNEIEEFARLDNVRLEVVTEPDLVLDGNDVTYTPGNYVPNADELDLTIVGRNQGVDIPLAQTNFLVKAYLSSDPELNIAEDFELATLTESQRVLVDNRYVYNVSRTIPGSVPAGSYYLIVAVDSDNLVTPEVSEDNNLFVSSTPDVVVTPLPDIRVALSEIDGSQLFSSNERDPTTNASYRGVYFPLETLELNFTLTNDGLAAAAPGFNIQVVLTEDSLVDENDLVLTTIREDVGLPVGQTRSYVLSLEIPADIPIGVLYEVALIIDPLEEIAESNEANNRVLSPSDYQVVFSEVEIIEALDTTLSEIKNGEENPQGVLIEAPFIGESDVDDNTFDNVDALRTPRLRDGDVASIEAVFRPSNQTLDNVISFAWKSENVLSSFRFFINNQEQASLLGVNDWEVVRVTVEPQQSYILRWEYTEGDIFSENSAYLDLLRTNAPDLQPTAITLVSQEVPGVLLPGQTFSVDVDITNNGEATVPATPAVGVELRLSSDQQFDEDVGAVQNDFFVASASISQAIASEETITYRFENVQVPVNIDISQDLYILARVDTGDVVVEQDENNNTINTPSTDLSVDPNITVIEALDVDDIVLNPEQLLDFSFESEGAGTFYGYVDGVALPLTSDGIDSVQSSPIDVGEEVSLVTRVDGPVILNFDWRTSSVENSNALIFSVSGVEKARISGNTSDVEDRDTDLDFDEDGYVSIANQLGKPDGILIPAGTQELRWTYRKNVANNDPSLLDAGFIDRLSAVNDPQERPDLVMKGLTTTPGVYILDRQDDPDLDRLPVSAVAENQGYALDGDDQIPADISVRLSTDRTYGNEDDILLGEIARVGGVGSTDQFAFGGQLTPPLETPPGSYYLMAMVDYAVDFDVPNNTIIGDIDEIDETNNIIITDTREIIVERRADLIVENIQYDTSKRYVPEDILRLAFDVRNRGLAPVQGDALWNVQIDLLVNEPSSGPFFDGIFSDITANDPLGLFELGPSSASFVIPLATLPVSRYVAGVDEFNPSGQTIRFETELSLPTYRTIEPDPGDFVDGYWFTLLITVDPLENGNAVLESSEINFASKIDSFNIFTPPVSGSETFAQWGAAYGINDPIDDPDMDGMSNLLEYAFNLNPLFSDNPANQGISGDIGSTSFGMTTFEDEEFLRLTYDINIYASDLQYTVEVSSDFDPNNPIPPVIFGQYFSLEPPFTDDHGPNSLTGVGGLKDTNPQVISVSPRGRTARITVRDGQAADVDTILRLMRLRVTQEP